MKLFKSLFKKRPDSDLTVAKDLLDKVKAEEKKHAERVQEFNLRRTKELEQVCNHENGYLAACEAIAPLDTEFKYLGITLRILRYGYFYTSDNGYFSDWGTTWQTELIGEGNIHCEYWVDTVGFATRVFRPEDLKSIFAFPDRTPFVFKEDEPSST